MDSHNVKITHTYQVECFDKDGNLKWKDGFENLVTTEGKNKYLDATLKTGLTSPAWFVGLVKTVSTGYTAADTLASHAWTEAVPGTDYTGNRQAFTTGAIAGGSVDNTASKATFPILTTMASVDGALLASVATGTAGTLLGVGSFSGGSKSVSNGDTLQVSVTCTVS